MKPWKTIVLIIFLFFSAHYLGEILKRKSPLHQNIPLPELKPGEFVGTLLMGSFRALAIDLLWLRADRMRVEGKYFEELALLDLLAKLQPHISTAWVVNGQNLIYNISLNFRNKKKQWKWIRKGILFLKEGMEKNPNNPQIAKQLAFIFWHRLSQNSLGQLRRDPNYKTYFRNKFLKDSILNPQKKHNYAHTLQWVLIASRNLKKRDPIVDNMLIDSLVLMVMVEKSKKRPNRNQIQKFVQLGQSQEKSIKKENPRLFRSLLSKFCFLRREKASFLISQKKYFLAKKELDWILKRKPRNKKALQLYYLLFANPKK